MIMLHIEHSVADFDKWQASFATFEDFRQQSGVCRYQISRPIDNPNFAMIDLEFNSLPEAEALLEGVKQIWGRGINGTLINNPQWRFSEVVHAKEFQQ